MKILALLIAISLGLCVRANAGEKSEHLNYDEFIRAVEAGHVKEVKLDRFSQIAGTKVVDGSEQPFSSYAELGTANDPLLLRFLREKGVGITVDSERDPSNMFPDGCAAVFMGFGFFLGPVITIANLIILVMVYRQVRMLAKLKQPDSTT